MHLRDVMSAPPVTCRSTDTAEECARLMKETNRGFLPVVDAAGRLCGAVTDRDLATRILAVGGAPKEPVGTFATHDVVACRPDDELWVAEEALARERKSRLVVAERGFPIGVVSLADLAQVLDPPRFSQLYVAVTQRESTRILASGARAGGDVTFLV